jgi:guanylate kinase
MGVDLGGWEKPDIGALFVVVGSSGTGKSTLVREALRTVPNLCFSVSATTRSPRPGEVDGEDYLFVSPADFDRLVSQGAFLEWAEVYGNRYGTLRGPVDEALARGDSILLEIDTQGARSVRAAMPGSILIFVLPPSLGAIARRLRDRATDSEQVIARRIEEAGVQLKECGSFDYLVLNDRLDAAVDQFVAVFVAELLRRHRRQTWVTRLSDAREAPPPEGPSCP